MAKYPVGVVTVVLGVAVCLLSQRIGARGAAAELGPLRSIEAAEAEGRSFPRAPEGSAVNDLSPSARAWSSGGTAERRCTDTAGRAEVRSGDFIAGNFAMYSNRAPKLWWKPLHPPDVPSWAWPTSYEMPFKLRGTRLDVDQPSWDYNVMNWTRPTSLISRAVLPGLFVPSAPPIPSAGRWLLVATAGANWGCFILDLVPLA